LSHFLYPYITEAFSKTPASFGRRFQDVGWPRKISALSIFLLSCPWFNAIGFIEFALKTNQGSYQMSVTKFATSAVLALSLVAVPTIAAAAPAASRLSVTAPTVAPRAGAPVVRKSNAGGSSIIIAVLAAAAVIAGIVIAADGNGKPTSA
jgi:hypothetical protein